jgi:hypothetical protein
MASIVCPNCGYRQEGGTQCGKCSTLFAYYQRLEDGPPAPAAHAAAPARGKSSPGLLRRVYRFSSWVSLAALALMVILVLHRSPPPKVSTDPQATARVESKLRESQSAAEAGQPHQLRLDEAEVNAYLGSNLALKQESAAAAAAPASPSPGAEPSIEEIQSSVKDVKINMLDDRVQAYVLFDFHGQDLSLVLEGRLGVEDGYLRFEPTSGKLGSLPIPQSTLESAVRRMLASPENKEKLRVPSKIGDIRIENGELVVSHR